ncbi:sugar transferase [Pseudonocardia sp. WMMC193]|nr:sugar transferase [Pseudonocardia sp. WMMC193]MCF7553849.1 sugar transferase [Pseudonocardia sp. WMMC193]
MDVASVALVVGAGWLLGYRHTIGWLGEPAVQSAPAAAGLSLLFLWLMRAWDPSVLGYGAEEFRRVVRALAVAAVVLGLTGLALESVSVRPWVFGLMPATAALATLGRWLVRKRLHRLRREGSCTLPLLAVGSPDSVEELIRRTRRDVHQGWTVVAACTPTGTGPDGSPFIAGVPVVGDLDSVSSAVQQQGPAVVSVSAAPGFTGTRLHRLAWDLEDAGAELVVDPGLMEIAGPRLHVAPVDGQPFLRLTKPTLNGVARAVKSTIDRIGAGVLLVLLAPVLVVAAAAVKLDGGPVFYRQRRVGHRGHHFNMIKFRSMVVDADAQVDALLAANEGSGPLFKMRTDPRVTRVGRTLRRYSIDELPQLLNVLTGSMSLVGPRPPLPREITNYSRGASRKFLVKPGLTGLWQVSGRSNLSWEESVRLDLRYVENWSLTQDAVILWKTFGAVFSKTGAY